MDYDVIVTSYNQMGVLTTVFYGTADWGLDITLPTVIARHFLQAERKYVTMTYDTVTLKFTDNCNWHEHQWRVA